MTDLTMEILKDAIFKHNIADFMRESNRIEGELEGHIGMITGALYPNDVRAAMVFLKKKKITEGVVLNLHAALSKPKLDAGTMKLSWCGRYRDFDVRVGKYIAPHFIDVPDRMKTYFKNLPDMNAWTAHNRFEVIHPFADLNGRVGRLIWLWKKMNEEGFQFGLPFLQEYYYDTLTNFENENAATEETIRAEENKTTENHGQNPEECAKGEGEKEGKNQS